jgi:endonuclease YncB( thermonuclease family)
MMIKLRYLLIVALPLALGSQLAAARHLATPQLPCHPDVNADLVVDLFDLVRVASRYGTQRPPGPQPRLSEDTNGDGVVDIADLVCVSANFGSVLGPVPTLAPAILATPTVSPTVPAPAECQMAWVEFAEDGDTVRVQVDGRVVCVDYTNINAPESSEPYGHQATMMNAALVSGKAVCLEPDPRQLGDGEGSDRLLRYVWVDGMLAQAELVEAGLAQVVLYRPQYKYEGWLLVLQEEAQQEGRGMWE